MSESINQALMNVARQKFSNPEGRVRWLETFKSKGGAPSYCQTMSQGKEWLYLEFTNPPFEGGRIGNFEYVESMENEEIDLPFIYYREKHIKVEDTTYKNEVIFFTKSLKDLRKNIREDEKDEANGKNEQLVSVVVLKDGQPFDCKRGFIKISKGRCSK